LECHNCLELLGAYADDELELSASLQIEQHVQDCAMCARAARNQRAIAEKLRNPSLRYAAGADLRERMGLLVRHQQSPAVPVARQTPPFQFSSRIRFWRSAAIAVMLALAASITFTAYREFNRNGGTGTLASEVLADHVRSLMAAHALDIISTDQHTVKPWFMGKLDFSPEVEDFKEDGFPLVGGRLDYLHGHAVAALVFQRRKHIINLFTWPLNETDNGGPAQLDQAGYHLRAWNAAGMAYWAISDVNTTDLENFVKLYRDRIK
jgi:anti-sigma factor RsiW